MDSIKLFLRAWLIVLVFFPPSVHLDFYLAITQSKIQKTIVSPFMKYVTNSNKYAILGVSLPCKMGCVNFQNKWIWKYHLVYMTNES